MMAVSSRAKVLLLTIILLFYLSACGGGLNGTYVSQGLISQSFTFDGDRITMSAFGINADGTYKIKGDQIEIVYSLFGADYTWTQSFSKSGNTINIGGTDFIKR